MNHQFEEEDRVELETHFRERVQAYVGLGETPEQALVSAREKFGEIQTALNELKWQRRRSYFLYKPLGVIGIGLIWGVLWAVMFAALLSILQLFFSLNSDEETLYILSIISLVGFISGGLFGLLLSLSESGKAILDISLRRVALWGILSSAVFPVLTGRGNQVFWTCPFGAIAALLLLALARKAERRAPQRSRRLHDLLFASVLTPVRFAVSPFKKPARR